MSTVQFHLVFLGNGLLRDAISFLCNFVSLFYKMGITARLYYLKQIFKITLKKVFDNF